MAFAGKPITQGLWLQLMGQSVTFVFAFNRMLQERVDGHFFLDIVIDGAEKPFILTQTMAKVGTCALLHLYCVNCVCVDMSPNESLNMPLLLL